MQDIPINGRNWMDLTMLAAGSRTNASSEVPQDRQGFFQTNVDGQSVDADGLLRAEPAALQPRLDRRVPADDQPLRRDPGPHDGHDGQRHHQVRH